MKFRLEICPIPSCNWGKSLANILKGEIWDAIRRDIYSRYNHKCGICQGTGSTLHCHEVWVLNDRTHIQKLVGIICLCEDCHNIVHWMRTVTVVHKGEYSQSYLGFLRKHFCAVNSCTIKDFDEHKADVILRYHKRNQYNWKIDWGVWDPDTLIAKYNKLRRQK